MLVVTQILSMLQSLALAILAFAHIITVTDILILQLAQGVINAFDTPARQTFLVEMVEDPKDLPNAIALNSSLVNSSRILGPSIGGILIAIFGEGWCFMIDAISYVAVIISLLIMHVSHPDILPPTTSVLEELRTGFRYVVDFFPVRTALILLALVGTMGMPYSVLMPSIASKVLHGGPHTLGFLMTASGLGALTGTIYLAARPSVVGLARVIVIATTAFGAGLICFSLSHTLWLSLSILPIVGAGFMVQMASTNTILQTIVTPSLRGRVMAFYTMAFLGTVPIGSLLAGVLADRLGSQTTILLGGIACLIGAAWFALNLPQFRAAVRPIYIERGILPPPPSPPIAPNTPST
jgi:MFS family permease